MATKNDQFYKHLKKKFDRFLTEEKKVISESGEVSNKGKKGYIEQFIHECPSCGKKVDFGIMQHEAPHGHDMEDFVESVTPGDCPNCEFYYMGMDSSKVDQGKLRKFEDDFDYDAEEYFYDNVHGQEGDIHDFEDR